MLLQTNGSILLRQGSGNYVYVYLNGEQVYSKSKPLNANISVSHVYSAGGDPWNFTGFSTGYIYDAAFWRRASVSAADIKSIYEDTKPNGEIAEF